MADQGPHAQTEKNGQTLAGWCDVLHYLRRNNVGKEVDVDGGY